MPVTSVTESQAVDDAGQLTNVYEITYRIADRPGTFTLTVPRAGDAVAAAAAQIAELEQQVGAIYGL